MGYFTLLLCFEICDRKTDIVRRNGICGEIGTAFRSNMDNVSCTGWLCVFESIEESGSDVYKAIASKRR